MLSKYLRRFLRTPICREKSLQYRLVVIVASYIFFLIPSALVMNYSYIRIYLQHYPWANLGEILRNAAMMGVLSDAILREVVLGFFFCVGLITILGASHGDSRFDAALIPAGFLLILESAMIIGFLTNRCTITRVEGGCSSAFYWIAIAHSVLFAFSGVVIPRMCRQQVTWFAWIFCVLLIYQSFIWFLDLARMEMIEMNGLSFRAAILPFFILGVIIFIAVIGTAPRLPGLPRMHSRTH